MLVRYSARSIYFSLEFDIEICQSELSRLAAAGPEHEQQVGPAGDDLRDGASPAQSHQRHGRLRPGHAGPVVGSEVVAHSLALGPETQAGVRLPVLLHPGALHPHPPGLALRHGDHSLNNREFRLVFPR